jgi:hypothetical protein
MLLSLNNFVRLWVMAPNKEISLFIIVFVPKPKLSHRRTRIQASADSEQLENTFFQYWGLNSGPTPGAFHQPFFVKGFFKIGGYHELFAWGWL